MVFLNRATIYLARRNYGKVEESLQRARTIWGKNGKRHRWEMGRVARDLGVIRERAGRMEESKKECAAAQAVWEEQVRVARPTLEMPMELAVLYASMGQLGRGRAAADEAVAIGRRELGAEHPRMGDLLLHYAWLLRQIGEKREAGRVEKEARQIQAASGVTLAGQTVDVQELN